MSACPYTYNRSHPFSKACPSCKWYAEYEGVCCNGHSEHRAEWPPEDLAQCPHWTEGKLDA